jgi:hypothetical protein
LRNKWRRLGALASNWLLYLGAGSRQGAKAQRPPRRNAHNYGAIYSSKTISLPCSTRAALFVLKFESFHKIGTRHDTALEQYRARKQAVAHVRCRLLTRAALFRAKV